MKRTWKEHVFVFVFFLFVALPFFRPYILKNQVPLPFNLLVSFYSPWKYEPIPGYPNGVPNKPIGSDIVKLFYPYRLFTTAQEKRGSVPLWNPYVFSGNVHAATYQAAVFYPFNIFYFLLPQVDAWTMLVMLQPIIAGFGMYFFLRSRVLSRRSSLFGAIAYAFSGWMITWWEESLVIEHSIIWLPYALWASGFLWQRRTRWKGFVLLFLSIAFSILAGFLQMTIYLGMTLIAWNTYLFFQSDKKERNASVAVGIIVVLLAGLATAVQWLPAVEAYGFSPRGTVKTPFLFESFLMPLYHLVTFLAPDFWGNPGSYNYFFPKVFYHEKVIYLGILPLIFALCAFFAKKRTGVTFWKIFSLVTLSLGFALPTSWIWYTLNIPILSVAQPSRIFTLATLGFSVLSAYGLEWYLENKKTARVFVVVAFLGLMLGVLWAFVAVGIPLYVRIPMSYPQFLSSPLVQFLYSKAAKEVVVPFVANVAVAKRNLIIPTLFLLFSGIALVVFKRFRRVGYTAMIVITLLSSLYFAQKFLYFSDRKFEFPMVEPIKKLKEFAGYDRVWTYGNAYIEKNIPSFYGLYSPEGYDALFPRRYGELMNTIKTQGVISDGLMRTDVDLKPMGEQESFESNPYRLRLMALLGVRYILESKTGEHKDVLSEEGRFGSLFDTAWENDRWRIWEFPYAWPRTFFSNNFIIETDRQKIANIIFDHPIRPIPPLVLEENPPGLALSRTVLVSDVTIVTYEPNRVILAVEARNSGLVFLSDSYEAGWKAYVDGKQTKIYRANYAFRAVAVGEGKHTVVFTYQPVSFYWAVILSAIGVVGFFGVVVYYWIVRRKNT